jgi:hypothetical protein
LALRFGRLPNDPSKPRIRLAAHLTGTAPPPSVDWYTLIPAWGMLGNDQYGDCVFAGNAHIIELISRYGLGAEAPVTTAQVLAEYARVTGFDPADPSTDQGATIQDGLADLRTNGLAGHRIAAFAEIPPANLDGVKTACAELGAVSLGVNLPHSAVDQFDAGEPWTVLPGDGGIAGGHCVILAGYDTSGVHLITWGRTQLASWQWFETYCEEAWAAVSRDWVGADGTDPDGVDLVSLGEEFAEVTGEPSPFPPPAPGPVPPVPPPAPDPVPPPDPSPGPDQNLAEAARPWVAARHHHPLANTHLAHALRAWLAAKGL